MIQSGKTEIFLGTLEKLSGLTDEIASFLQIPRFDLHNQNVGGEKWYSALYAEFKQRYCPPSSMLTDLYESKAARHFYAKAQRDAFMEKWKKEDR